MRTMIITLENASIYDMDALEIGIKSYIQDFTKLNNSDIKVSDINFY